MKSYVRQTVFSLFVLLAFQLVAAAQNGTLRLIVAGRELPGNVKGEQRGTRTFLPVAPIARELGYTIEFDATAETIRVRRAGIEAEFVKQTGEVRENGVTAIAVPLASEISFSSAALDALTLPIEAVAPLLDASIFVDKAKNSVRIEPRDAGTAVSASERGKFEIGGLNYNYNSTFFNGSFYQNLNLTSSGRIGGGVYQSNLNFIGGSRYGLFNFYSGNFTFKRKQGDEFQAGDLAVLNSELQFMNTPTRGASYARPIFGDHGKIAVYGGRSSSGVRNDIFTSFSEFAAPRRKGEAPTIPFDTTLSGVRFGYSPEKLKNNRVGVNGWYFSGGAVYFNGAANKGLMLDAAARYASKRFNLQAEIGAGSFDIRTQSNREIKGFGTGLSINASYSPWQWMNLHGRYDRFSPKFSNPMRTEQYTDRETKSLGVSVQPLKNLSLGATATIGDNKNQIVFGRTEPINNRTESYNLNLSYSPEIKILPNVSVSAMQLKSTTFGSFKIISASFNRDFKNFRPFVNYFMTSGNNTSGHGFHFGTGVNIGKFGQFQAQHSVAVNKAILLRRQIECDLRPDQCLPDYDAKQAVSNNHNFSVDWTARERLFKVLQLSVGGGYASNQQRAGMQFRTTAAFFLPFKQNLQVSYFRSIYNSELRFSITGPLAFWKPKKLLDETITNETLVTIGTIRGRAFQDENGNRQYDAGIDIPMADVRVRLDNGYEVMSDQNGLYSFDRVPPGDHRIAVNIEDVRANLIPANGLEQKITVAPRTIVNTSFRMVKSGSLSGRVWHDGNANGKFDEGEGLADIHILSSSGKDTYSDLDGTFLLSELPPGEQTIFIDERYIPEGFTNSRLSERAEVVSGAETKNILFHFKIKPREIKEINFGDKP